MRNYIYSLALSAVLGTAVGLGSAYAGDNGSPAAPSDIGNKSGSSAGSVGAGAADEIQPTDRRGSSANDPDPGIKSGSDMQRERDADIGVPDAGDRPRGAGDAPAGAERDDLVPPEGGFGDPNMPGRPIQ